MTKTSLSGGFALTFFLCGSVLPQQAIAAEQLWWHEMIGATKANQKALKNGVGVRVGVIDGAAFGVSDAGVVTFIHPEFGGRLDSFYGYPQGPGDWSNYNEFGDDHGTHVAGIIGASRDGTGMKGMTRRKPEQCRGVRRFPVRGNHVGCFGMGLQHRGEHRQYELRV